MNTVVDDAYLADLVERHHWWKRYDPFVLSLLGSQLGPAEQTHEGGHPLVLCQQRTGVSRVWLRRLSWSPKYVRQLTIRTTDRRFIYDDWAEHGSLCEGHGASFQLCLAVAKSGPLRVYDWALYDLEPLRRWLDSVSPVPHLFHINPEDGNEYLRIPASMLPAYVYRLNADTFRIPA